MVFCVYSPTLAEGELRTVSSLAPIGAYEG